MGLPSGLRWASCNLGAKKPSDYGVYFSWGNIQGHALDEGYDFTQEVYNSTPAAAIETDLTLDQDAAAVNLGDPWRMPTAEDFQELVDNCTYVWTTVDGVRGRLFTSNVNGNTLFFPAAGYYIGTTLNDSRSRGFYWSSTYLSATNAKLMGFSSEGVYPQSDSVRRIGCPVRSVCPTS